MTYLDSGPLTAAAAAAMRGAPLALVTGAAGGIGAGIVDALLADGYAVVATDVDRAGLERVCNDHRGAAVAVAVHDVSSATSWSAVVDPVRATVGRLDALVNNAGVLHVKQQLAQMPVAEFRKVFDVNVLGTLLGTQSCVPLLEKSVRASIVNFSSGEAFHATAGFGAYTASKWALRGLTKTTAVELAEVGIRCNSVHPWGVASGMTQGADGAESLDRLVAGIPLGRVGLPAEVGALVAFLTGPASSFSTGAEFVVDGGAVASSGF